MALQHTVEGVHLAQNGVLPTGCREGARPPDPPGPQEHVIAQKLEANFHLHRQAAVLIHVDLLLNIVTSPQ